MAPTLLGKKTENCRTSGPPIFEVVSGKSICMLFEPPEPKLGKGNISLSTFHFQPNLLFEKGWGLHLVDCGAKAATVASAVHSIDSV